MPEASYAAPQAAPAGKMCAQHRSRQKLRLTKRDGKAHCHYCGYRPPAAPLANLTVDHVVPRSLGGTNRLANLVLACKPCNEAKDSALWFGPLVFQ